MIARLWSSHWRSPEPVRSSLAGCELTAPEKKGWRQPNGKFEPPSSLSSVILDIIDTQAWKPCRGSYLFIQCVCLARWFVISAGCKVGILPALPKGTDILTLPFTNIAWEHFWGTKGPNTLDCTHIYRLCMVQAGCISFMAHCGTQSSFIGFVMHKNLLRGIHQQSHFFWGVMFVWRKLEVKQSQVWSWDFLNIMKYIPDN